MQPRKNKPRAWQVFSALSILLLTACATAPSAPPECPKLPELVVRVPTGLNYQALMADFLRGSLPSLDEPTPDLKPATAPSTR